MAGPLRPIRLAIVDDSAFMRRALARLLEAEPAVHVVGQAASGEELLENFEAWRPDMVTLDLSMPGMGGLATLDRLREVSAVPVIILSTHSAKDAPLTIEALHRGAADFIDKQQYSLVDFDALRTVLVEKLLGVAQGRKRRPPAAAERAAAETPPEAGPSLSFGSHHLAVLGASTGGPPAVQLVLESLGGPPPVPIVLVQHMPLGFTRPFAERLNAHLPMAVREAAHAEELLPGTVYVAPSGVHTRIKREGAKLFSVHTKFPEDLPHRPSVDVLFSSAAQAVGARCIGVLMTGMGRDGAEGMAELHKAGAYTLAQGPDSCVVYGMPKAAVDLGAVRYQTELPDLGRHLAARLASSK